MYNALQKIPPARLQQTLICIITIKIVAHMFAAEALTCICADNCITTTETVTCIIVTERSANIPVTESNT